MSKSFSHETPDGCKYKITPAHFVGNIGNDYGYLFSISKSGSDGGEFEIMLRLPRDIAIKKWQLKNRSEEEEALLLLGALLVKRELDRASGTDGCEIKIAESTVKGTLNETLEMLKQSMV